MHMPEGGLIADVTWGRGVFWKKIQNGQPNLFNGATYTIIGSDIEQRADVKADFRCLPYRDETFDCVVLDPPWANLSTAQKTLDQATAYGLKPISVQELRNLYLYGMGEAKRIVKTGRTVIVKCQDIVTSGKRIWLNDDVVRFARYWGLNILDRMIQVQNGEPPLTWHVKQQRHFRARESFFWIFRKV